jgi:hypothetical protein
VADAALRAAQHRLQEIDAAARPRRQWVPDDALTPEIGAARAAADDIFRRRGPGSGGSKEEEEPANAKELKDQLGRLTSENRKLLATRGLGPNCIRALKRATCG